MRMALAPLTRRTQRTTSEEEEEGEEEEKGAASVDVRVAAVTPVTLVVVAAAAAAAAAAAVHAFLFYQGQLVHSNPADPCVLLAHQSLLPPLRNPLWLVSRQTPLTDGVVVPVVPV